MKEYGKQNQNCISASLKIDKLSQFKLCSLAKKLFICWGIEIQ